MKTEQYVAEELKRLIAQGVRGDITIKICLDGNADAVEGCSGNCIHHKVSFTVNVEKSMEDKINFALN